MSLFDVSNKCVLITGSSRGIGNALAAGFASAGSRVILNGKNLDNLERAVAELKKTSPQVSGYQFDVTDYHEVRNTIQKIEEEVGSIDILINNAGIHSRAPLSEMKIEEWKRVIEVNLNAVFFISQQVADRMKERGGGKIINIGSINAEGARASIANYCAAKGGLKMLTKSMATEWGPFNIHCNAIGPGYFKTELTKKLYEDPAFDAWVKQEVPLKRWGRIEELVGTSIFLASEASSYINGFTIYVDGGWQASL